MKGATVRGAVVCAGVVALALGGHAWWTSLHRPSPPASSTSRPAHPPVGTIYGIAPNLFVIPGGGGNTAVFVTTNGVVFVDTKYTDRYEAMLDQLRTVTDKPITHVINTHAHGDHMGGNESLPPGVEIIVQENTAAHMEEMRRSWDPRNEHGRPLRTYKDRLTLFSGQDAIDLYYSGAAHTDGDTFVVFRSAGVMHAGDVFPDKVAPIINIRWGGNGLTYGETIGNAAALINNVNYVISGHGPVLLWNDFVEYGEFGRMLLEHARAEATSGKDAHQALEELRLPAKFKNYGLRRAGNTLEEIFWGLTSHDPGGDAPPALSADDR